ncbi:flavin reductase family protein [uncultured Lentibacter sp.]|jgi:flavin reductase (DIM6/NTAB) family NADH-FMN oxidoreductase RutF|uniref:flavin reductase family protein n=1 Tax=uncultured Lentibacter sp. TaxID=1659309 RepID=UPI0026041297|nr:flavin reductase family protein [uncultured Lentibacter sp.]
MTSLDPRELRRAFGSFMTGVTVVTALRADGSPVGFTANSFTSVSLEPPLVLVCPGKFLSSFDAFTECRHFAINILAEGQEAVSNTFASFKGDRFAQIEHSPDAQGVPLIHGVAASFSCRTERVIPAGDHAILMGEVTDFAHAQTAGLGYVSGQYFSLGLERAAFEDPHGPAICGAIVEDGDHVLMVQTNAGLHPPQCAHKDRGRLIEDLQETLAQNGIEAELGQAYSVFESHKPRAQHSYFLASGRLRESGNDIRRIPISRLPEQQFSSPAIARMMTRFALESQTRVFGLYLGTTEDGSIHDPMKRT